MNSRTVRSAAAGGLVGIVLALVPTAVGATVYSDWKNFWTNNTAYQNRSSFEGPGNERAWTEVRRSNGTAGYPYEKGTKVRVYFQGGASCNTGTWSYNPTYERVWASYLDHNCGGYIYSKGATNTYTGGGYEFTDAFKTDTVLR